MLFASLFPTPALCYTDRTMTGDIDRVRWEQKFADWGTQLRAWQLDGLAASFLDAAEPLSVLGAQMLYVAQPALGVFLPREDVGQLARLLEDPANLVWMREALIDSNGTEAGSRGEHDHLD